MNKIDDNASKLRELLLLEGVILALKNQMNMTYNELSKVRDKQYKISESTDEQCEVMNRIDKMLDEIDDIWNNKLF